LPDTISSDLHAVSVNTPGTPVLPWVMSKFLALGLDVEEVVRRATTSPARVIDRVEGLGTLSVGAPGDVSVLELVEEPVTFLDTAGEKLRGDRYFRPVTAVRAGRPFATPYPGPVPYPQPFGFPF
ncbi:MAG: amidohydrolase, partial [Actinomycetota bacterium]|nr:amidohydrolase [Actinomycetota bacterium]